MPAVMNSREQPMRGIAADRDENHRTELVFVIDSPAVRGILNGPLELLTVALLR